MVNRPRARSFRLFSLVLLGIIVSLAGLPAAPPVKAVSTRLDSTVVERWRGRINVQGTLNATLVSLGTIPGYLRQTYTLDFDLKVYEDGFLHGDVTATFKSMSFEQISNTCGYFLKCRVGISLGSPVAKTFVEGQRFPATNNVAEFVLRKEIEISPATYNIQMSVGPYSQTSTENLYADVLPAAPFKIQLHPHGRPPTAEPKNGHILSPTEDFTFQGQLIAMGTEPMLALDPELLERSVFLAQVPIEDNFDANIDWNSVDAGWVDWQFGASAPERVGPTRSTKVSKKVNVGPPSPGQSTLLAQAHNTAGKSSSPETSIVTIAPPVTAPTTRTSPVSGAKQGDIVAYKHNFKFPEPAFKAEVPKLPDAVPFFNRGPLGIPVTQMFGEAEYKSTGEGSYKAGGSTGFKAMGGEAKLELSVKGKAALTAAGLTFPEGEFEVKGSGKIKGEESLIKFAPGVGPFAVAVASKFPAAQRVLESAKVVMEIEPKLPLLFHVIDEGGDLVFKKGQAKPAIGISASIVLNLIEDVLSVTGTAGGEITAYLQVPAPYSEGFEVKLRTAAQVLLFHYANTFEYAISHRYSGSMLAAGASPNGNHQAETNSKQWTMMDRAYLDDPDYGRWTASTRKLQSAPNDEAWTASDVSALDDRYDAWDRTLVANVFPQAAPDLAARATEGGTPELGLVWSHDKLGSPALSGQDIKFSTGSNEYIVTNDNLSDLAPQTVFLPDGTQLILWQRFDTATPGDMNTNMGAYLSHAQIAAVPFNYNSSARATPQQLSTSGSLNYRHQLGALNNGALAVWVNNPNNQIMGDAANPDRIQWARYTQANGTGSWSPVGMVLPAISGLVDYKLATMGGHAALVYSQDRDGDTSTDVDQELFYTQLINGAWTTPQRLTNNNVADAHPQLALTTAGTPLLVWQQAGQLQWLKGNWSNTPTPLPLADAALRSDFQLVGSDDGNVALTWQEVESGDTRIGYAIYDAKYARWGDVRTVATNNATATGSTTMAHNISAALVPTDEWANRSRARLIFGYQLANVQSVTQTIDGVVYPNTQQIGTHSLHLGSVPLGNNLSIAAGDLKITPANAQPGTPLTLEAVVHNVGDMAIPANTVPVALQLDHPEDGMTEVASKILPALSAGESAAVTFQLTKPVLGDGRYSVEVNPLSMEDYTRSLREQNYDDNRASVGSELAIDSTATYYASTGAVARAEVTQSGGLYNGLVVTSTLRLGTPDGPIVGTAPIGFPVTPTDTLVASSFISSTVLGAGSHQLWWEVDPDGILGEANRDDNLTATTVNVMPDLSTEATLVGWSQAPGTSVPVSLRVQNEGNWLSNGGFVELWDNEPGKAGTHLLGRIALPQIPPGQAVELEGTLNLVGLPAAATGLKMLYVQLDPAKTIAELNENNNLTRVGGMVSGPTDGLPVDVISKMYLPLVRR